MEPPAETLPGTPVRIVRYDAGRSGLLPAADAVYVVRGDVTRGPVRSIGAEPGVDLRPPGDRIRELRVLHINDLHGQVNRPTYYNTDRPVLARIAWYLAQPHPGPTLLLSAGDELSGSILDHLLDDAAPCHVPYRLYSRLGLSAAAIGNHDLDRGEAGLLAAARQASFPLLAANLVGSDAIASAVYPAAVFVLGGLRIAVIGLITQGQLRRRPNETWTVSDPLSALRNLLPALRPLADVVIVLSHLGYSLTRDSATVAPLGDVELAACLPRGNVHLIVGGHTHDELNADGLAPSNVVNGIPIVQAGSRGHALGEVSLVWRSDPQGGGIPVVEEARLIATADLQTDESFESEQVRPLVARAMPRLERVIGWVAPLPGLTTAEVRREVDSGESSLANFVTQALAQRCQARGIPVDLAMIDASILRQGLQPAAELTVLDWFRVIPYADAVRLYRITGAHLAALLGDNALRIGRPDEPRTERGFIHFSSEVGYVLRPGASRFAAVVEAATVCGLPLADELDREYLIACHSHFRESAAAWERTVLSMQSHLLDLREWPYEDTELSLRDEVIAYCERVGGVSAWAGFAKDGRVRVARAGGALRDGQR